MIKFTVVYAYDKNGKLVDEFSFSHAITKKAKYHLSVFLFLHYSLHPKGYIETRNFREVEK